MKRLFVFLLLWIPLYVFTQELVIFTSDTSRHPSVVDFNQNYLAQIKDRMSDSGFKVTVYTDVIVKGVAALPSIYFVDSSTVSWYKGRYNTIDRMLSFVNNANRFEFDVQKQELKNVLVEQVNDFQKITRLKITPITFHQDYKGDRGLELQSELLSFIEGFQDTITPLEQFKVYYFDLYPYVDENGKWYVSSKIFSQHNCIEPVIVLNKPFTGTLREVAHKAANWYQMQIDSLYDDVQYGDGLELINKQIKLSWDSLGYVFDTAQVAIKTKLIDSFDLKINTSIVDPVRFSFSPPLDNYNGSFGQVRGAISYQNKRINGEIKVDITSLDMGEVSLNQSVFGQLLGKQFNTAFFRFEDSLVLDNQKHILTGEMELLGRRYAQDVVFRIVPLFNGQMAVKAEFKIDIRPFSSLEQPDGVSPLNHMVYVNVEAVLTENEMKWKPTQLVELPEQVNTSVIVENGTLEGDFVLNTGEIVFTTQKHNVRGSTTVFEAALNRDGWFAARVDLNTLNFVKGKVMKKHAVGNEGLQVGVFPLAFISGKLKFDKYSKVPQKTSTQAELTLHGVTFEVPLEFVIQKLGAGWEVNTVVPVDRSLFNLNGKKARSIDDVIYVNVHVVLE